VRLGEPVGGEGERGLAEPAHDLLVAPVGAQGLAEAAQRAPQPGGVLGEAHRAPELLGLPAAEASQPHCQLQHLLLEQDHAEGAGEDRPRDVVHAGIEVGHGL
jgi:hypothetical protein